MKVVPTKSWRSRDRWC